MPKKMGYQGLLYVGSAGTTAATPLLRRVDATFELTPETGSTTSAGDGTKVPVNTGEAVAITEKVTFNCIVDTEDTTLSLIYTAAKTGAPIALKFVSQYGDAGFDRDCIISLTQGAPLKGEQTWDVSVENISASLRAVTSS